MRNLVLCLLTLLSACAAPPGPRIRVATFNVALNRPAAGDLERELDSGTSEQAAKLAEIIQRIRPDVVLLCEFDRDAPGRGLDAFRREFLEVSRNLSGTKIPPEAMIYPYAYAGPVNTGIPSGRDLNKDGIIADQGIAGAQDAFGFGLFPGQYGLAILSIYPIDFGAIRSFQHFLWKRLPGARLPKKKDGSPWYDAGDLSVLRLSSKSHWDVPIQVGDRRLHLLASHPTPPVFDGPEDRNGLRNHDEIRFWVEYLDDNPALVDDRGRKGGLPAGEAFVVLGDLNADPFDGDATDHPLDALLSHHRIAAIEAPKSEGGREQARLQGGANLRHKGPPAEDSCDIPWDDRGPGNLRLDYLLPSENLEVLDSGIFWPLPDDLRFDLISASDHRMVWISLELP